LVFINVIISVVDMMSVGRAGSVGWKTIVAYTITTLIASVLGIIAILIFKPLFKTADFPPKEPAMVLLGCTNTSEYLTDFPDGNVGCAADVTLEESRTFTLKTLVEALFVPKDRLRVKSLSVILFTKASL
jgi:hypothetical protein